MEDRIARWNSEAQHHREISAATAEWLGQAAAATPPPDPEILDHIREAVETLERMEESDTQWMIKGSTERLEELSPPPAAQPATTPETAPLYEHMIDAHGYGRSRGLWHRTALGTSPSCALHDSVLYQYPGERGRVCEDWR